MFIKDITYQPPEVVNSPAACATLLDHTGTIGGAGDYIRLSTLLLQSKFGAQLWVDKHVSDDLLAADIDPSEIQFAEIAWPEPRLEVYFEDPELPTMLASLSSNNLHTADLRKLLQSHAREPRPPSTQRDDDEPFVSLQVEDTEGSILSVTYRLEDLDTFAAGDTPDVGSTGAGNRVKLEESEKDEMRFLALLLFKVLLLASSDGHEIRRTREKPTRRQGGKPGFKNRPATDRLIVEYLPRHFEERRKAASAESGKHHKFNGRRGHWRRFHSPKFTKMRGKKKFIYPIPGPDGTLPRKKFVVKKLSQAPSAEHP